MGAKRMRLLEERIRKDGHVKAGNVLKVDSFLNHQMDIDLFQEMGKEFAGFLRAAALTRFSPSRPPASGLLV